MKSEEKAKVLIVDDQPQNLLALEAVLEAPGLELVKAGSGIEALKHLLSDEFAVILLDVKMPHMDGFETAALIRQRDKTSHTPIIFVTGYGSEEGLFRGYYAGAVDYLFRPVVPEVLRSKVSIFVDLYRKNQFLKRTADTLQRELDTQNQNLDALIEELAQRRRSEQAARAEAEEANRAKDRFLAAVSHELRTPLAAILGWCPLLRGGDLDADAAGRALDTIERNAKVQAQLVEQLLDVSRIIGGKLRVDLHPLGLSGVIEAATDTVRPAAAARGIRLDLALDPKAGLVNGDPGRLQQVMWNLLSNAIKFTPSGGSALVRLQRVNSYAEISVSDTGQGISAEFMPHIFELFRQADETCAQPQAGLGLGLALVRNIVELHGGSVRAESPGEGKGAVFTVAIPLLEEAFAAVGGVN